jgi:DNA-binding CsgD family transcriptional regulator
MTGAALVGRAMECARLDGLLEDASRGRSGVLVLSGEAGVGKTALLGYASSKAGGMKVVSFTAAQGEADLAYAGLYALLSPLLHLMGRLPAVQAKALGSVLGLHASPEGEPQSSPRLLAAFAGVLGLLAESAEEEPLLVMVDDAHWLDSGSAAALSFVARRLRAERVAILLAERPGTGSPFEAQGFATLQVRGLDAEASQSLVEAECGTVVSPRVSARLAQVCAGNPLALLEVARSLRPAQLSGAEPLPDPVPVPADIASMFLPAITRLPPATQRLLLLAAIGEGLPLAELSTAAGTRLGCDGDEEELVLPAEQAQLASVEGGKLVFRHPLVRASVLAGSTSVERRAAHRALAEVLVSPADADRRAWHLAAATQGPSEEVAGLLEKAAERARQRGGYGAEAAALERSAELSEDEAERARRLHAACRAAYWAGDTQRALRLGEAALRLAKDRLLRVDVVHQLAVIAGFDAKLQASAPSIASLEQDAAEVEPLDGERAIALLGVVLQRHLQSLRAKQAHEVAARRLAIAERVGSSERLLRSQQDFALTSCLCGYSAAAARLLDEIAARRARWAQLPPFASQVATVLLYMERYEELRDLLTASLSQARAEGNLLRVCFDLTNLALFELRLGRLAAAYAAASEGLLLARAMGSDYFEACNLATLAGVSARRGPPEHCREQAKEAAKLAASVNDNEVVAQSHAACGLLALGTGRLDEALAELERAAEAGEPPSLVEPGVHMIAHDLVEVRARLGRAEEAACGLARLEEVAEATGRRWAKAAAARCRALLAEGASSQAHFEEALQRFDAEPLLFEQARTRLYYGERLRRAQQKVAARRQLRNAIEQFDALSAHLFADRARAELSAAGETVGPRAPEAMEALTAQESQIARLVAEGKTNREVSEAVFLSPKTVEYHLAHIYRKLGLHSRRELIRIAAASVTGAK